MRVAYRYGDAISDPFDDAWSRRKTMHSGMVEH